MNRQHLNKLERILNDKFLDVLSRFSPREMDKVFKTWEYICDSLKITRLDHEDCEPGGHVFEEYVVIEDPSPGGSWLEMTHETALKILTLGIP